MVLNIDGSRNRRFGLDYETGYSEISTTVEGATSSNLAITTFRWDNAGGDSEKSLLVVQTGNVVKFFDLDVTPISNGLIYTHTFNNANPSQRFSYAVVDGILVVASGVKTPATFTYDEGIISAVTITLRIRDFFGVEDIVHDTDLFEGASIQARPDILTPEHLYNLRNQSWGVSRINGDTAGFNPPTADPIDVFRSVSNLLYPSNSDTVNAALYANPAHSDNRLIERFYGADIFRNPLGTTRAASGYFIIDALERGTSRLENEAYNRFLYPSLIYGVSSLPEDRTPGGPTAVGEFAGRAWFAGFSGEVINGDRLSPRMSSYVLFSKVVDSIGDIAACYQEGDPTAKYNSEIVDTDGGFIRLNGAYGIQRLISLGSSLMAVASNGVWRITGGTDNGFTATSYIVEKITDRGCTSPDSIVQVDNTIIFWSDDAIYHVSPDQFGTWHSNNISFGRIQRFYDNISIDSKRFASGGYDSYERKVRWLYNTHTTNTSEARELVFDIQLSAFYTNTIKQYNDQVFPKPVSIYLGLPYSIDTSNITVLVGNDPVLVGTEEVTITLDERLGINQRELGYLIITDVEPTISYTFGKYTNTQFRDWYSIDNQGVDADAYLITSYLSGGDFQRKKQVPYITVHLRRTEIGYDELMNPLNPSSCLVQARWGWSNSDNSGKWGREFQAYRYRRLHLPLDQLDDYDNGFATIVSKNKLRGTGRVLSLRFRTEPFKDLHLYGWSMLFTVLENV